MEKDLFKELENVEQIPMELLNKVNSSEDEIFSHTATGESDKINDFKDPEIRQGFNPNASGNDFLNATPYAGQTLNVGTLFNSKIAVDLMDVIIPALLVVAVTKYTSQKVNKSKFQLTAGEKNTLSPVLQNYLNSINFSVESPLNALILTVTIIYGSKTIEVIGAEIETPKADKRTSAKFDEVNERIQARSKDANGKPFTRKEGETRGRKRKI